MIRAMQRPSARSAIVILIAATVLATGCDDGPDEPGGGAVSTTRSATFVGRQACTGCHLEQTERWRGSHHDLAMDEATEETVLGDFADATFEYAGITSTFFRRDGAFFVRTDGPEGKLEDFRVAYVFGVQPLQQYLIAFPDGRYQAL